MKRSAHGGDGYDKKQKMMPKDPVVPANGRIRFFQKNEYFSSPQSDSPPMVLDLSPGVEVLAMVSSSHHTILRTSNGYYGFGSNDHGELGLGLGRRGTQNDWPSSINEMIPLDFLDALQNGPGIRDIVVGDEHTIVLTLSGELYGFGSNHYGQLGVVADQNSSSIYTLQRLYAPAGMRGVICGVSAGARHTIFATNEGYLYGFGENALNPLGPRVDLRGTFIPQQLFIQPIVDGEVVKTTRNCTIVQMTNGDLWAWGNNNLGQLGLGHQNSVSEPTRICSVHNVMRVMMGERHTVVVTREGQLYGCGDVEAFQGFLENTSLSDHLLRFQPLPLQNHEMPLALAVGGSHTVVVSTNGVVYNSCRDIRFQIPEGEIFVAVTATIEGTILATRVG